VQSPEISAKSVALADDDGFPMTAARLTTLIALGAALSLGAGCGRKSDLDTPYDAAIQARKNAQRTNQPVPPEPEKPVEDKPFILDRLIQ
jgi:predicted small lipoprotein YifL